MDNLLLPGKEQRSDKAIVYIRVSTEEQVENYSLGTQEDICRKEAEKRGLTVVQVFREEGRSAKTISGRPTLIEMLEYCRKHKREIGSVIVYRLDRVSRQTSDYLAIRRKLAECEIKLISATEPTGNSPTEKFVETMLAGFAQMDNDIRSERAKNGLRARFQAGLTSYVTMGYLNQNGYITKDKTFDKLQASWHLFATGTKTLRDIADILTKDGVGQRHKGGRMLPQQVNRMFRNKFYAGFVVSKKYGQEVRGQHPPMVTEELFYKVQAILDGRNHNISRPLAKRHRDNPNFPLRRIVKCKICGTSFTGGKSKGKREYYGYYFCPHRCKDSNVTNEKITEDTIDYLSHISLTENTAKLLNAFLRRTYFQRAKELQKRREEADSELKKQYELRQALIEKNLSGIYSDEIFKEQNGMIEEKITSIQFSKNDALLDKYSLEPITEFVETKLTHLPKTFEQSMKKDPEPDLGQIRMLLCSIFPSGMPYGRNGYSNTEISPFYRAILDLQPKNPELVSLGGEGGIRTLEDLATQPPFQGGAINH
jgi:site-specific DNA recombinase